MKKFLTAKWQDLIMANYEVDPALLESRLPSGTSLDLHEDKCFVSLVGFMFLNTTSELAPEDSKVVSIQFRQGRALRKLAA